MAEEKSPARTLGFKGLSAQVAEALSVSGVVVITRDAHGCMRFDPHGATHAEINEMLSRAMQANLNMHDEHVRAGAAGEDAQRFQRELDALANADAMGAVQ